MKFSTDLALHNGILFCPRSECPQGRSASTVQNTQILVLCVLVRMRIRANADETEEVNGVSSTLLLRQRGVCGVGRTHCASESESSQSSGTASKVSQSIMARKPDLWEGADRPD